MKKIYLLATAVAIMTGFAVYVFISGIQANNQPVIVQYEMVDVVVAAADIPANTKLTPELLSTIQIPKESVAPQAVKDTNELVGKTTKYPISQGEQFFYYKAAEIGDSSNNRLSDRIKPGYRAYTIYTDEVSGIAGYLKVGDKVDIMVTIGVEVEQPPKEAGAETETVTETMTYYFLENISVIAVGSASQYTGASVELKSYTNITLEVPAEDCPMLEYNVTQGLVKIVLRSFGDDKGVGKSVYKMEKAGVWIN